MPPQATRKPTHPEHAARRPTPQQTFRKRSIIEIEDDAASESGIAGPAESQSNSQSQTHSQAGVNQLGKLMEDMTNDQRKRHQFTKAHIHKDHDKAISSTKTAIATLFDDHEAQASLAHEAQMHRLRRLLDEKKKVETQMQTKITALRKEYRSHASDLQRAAEQRARQLS